MEVGVRSERVTGLSDDVECSTWDPTGACMKGSHSSSVALPSGHGAAISDKSNVVRAASISFFVWLSIRRSAACTCKPNFSAETDHSRRSAAEGVEAEHADTSVHA